jgi:hypothetical protein
MTTTHWEPLHCEESVLLASVPLAAGAADAAAYEALARGWPRRGRALPNRHEREWAALAAQPPRWPRHLP